MPSRANEVLSAHQGRRRQLLDALGKPGGELIEKPIVKAVLMTDVCVATYSALGETLIEAMTWSSQRMRALTETITHDGNAINQSAAEVTQAGAEAREMLKAVSAFKVLTYETLQRTALLNADLLKFIDLVADETALAVLSPAEPRLSTAVLSVAWDKLVDEVVDAASLFVISVMREMRKQLPDSGAAISYLSQLDAYTKTAEKALTLIECLRQTILDRMSDQPNVDPNHEALASRAAAVITERSATIAASWQ